MPFLVLSLVSIAALVIFLVLIARSSNHASRIGNLEWHLSRLQTLERQVNELTASINSLKDQIADLAAPVSRKKESAQAKVAPPVQEPQTSASTVTSPSAPRLVALPPKPAIPAVPSRTREEWEALIGGKLFNRIGALALIIGVGYFLKYAFDNNWISETTRVLIGAVIGFACLGGGYRTNKKGFQVFAQGLVGAGIAILYLSVYAAFNFYQLLPQWVAFVFMSIVTLIAFLNGLFYDSLAEGILGWAGGFLTPILLSTGQANEVGLFSYIVLLDAGLLAMALRKKQWSILEPLTFLGTWVMYLLWNDPYYTDADLGITVLFVTLFWLLFLAADFLRARKTDNGSFVGQIVPTLNAFVYFFTVYALINKDNHSWMGLVTLTIGAVYFLIYLTQQRQGAPSRSNNLRMILTTTVLVVLATSIQFNDFNTVMAWSVEAAVLIWLSKRECVEYLDIAALSLFGLAVFKLLFLTEGAFAYSPIVEFTLLANHRALAFTVVSIAIGFSAFVVDGSAGKRKQTNSNILHSAWCAMLFFLVTAEMNDYFRFYSLNRPTLMMEQMSFFRILSFSVFWISLSIPFLWVGLKRRLVPPVVAALVVALLALVFGLVRGIAFDPIETFKPVLNIRTISLLMLGTGLLLQTQMIRRSAETFDWLNDIVKFIQVGIMIVVLVLLTGETRDYFQQDIVALAQQPVTDAAETSRLSNLQQLMLSGVWLVYSVALLSVGIWRKYRGMRFVAMALFGITILKIFLYDLSFLQTLYRLFSFIALGLMLLAVSWAYQRYKDVIFGKPE